ncbi:hypothetical protein C6P45_004939 [Maudiozyma exigua]|uniref:Uncharacterized protein n=1 Tax=Maudiozyma exigua TaxID=34358 RepID=A0A9P6W9K4_MAUEX|nr:hypothetical protein C6P45_004939 [Kazachstania exigua]
MGGVFEVRIESSVLSEVNYKYELKCSIDGYDNVAQCFLLLGAVDTTITINKCIEIPIAVNGPNHFAFVPDIELFQRRLTLVKQVISKDIVPVGIILINSKIFQYDELIQSIFVSNCLELSNLAHILFHYEPLKITNNFTEHNLSLECYTKKHDGTTLKFQRKIFDIVMDDRIDISTESLKRGNNDRDATLQDPVPKSIKQLSGTDYSPCATQEFNRINDNENQLVSRLIKRIEIIISFLKKDSKIPQSYNSNHELILRKVSILVSRLGLGGTDDIENEVMNKENEIKLLQIACNQWEMVTPH